MRLQGLLAERDMADVIAVFRQFNAIEGQQMLEFAGGPAEIAYSMLGQLFVEGQVRHESRDRDYVFHLKVLATGLTEKGRAVLAEIDGAAV